MHLATSLGVTLLALVSLFGAAASTSAPPQASLATHSLPLYHRTRGNCNTSVAGPWIQRGVVKVDAIMGRSWFEEIAETGGGWDELEGVTAARSYQVALGRKEGVPAEEETLLSVVLLDSCILLHPKTIRFEETLTLFFAEAPRNDFVHFRYATHSLEGCRSPPERKDLTVGPGLSEASKLNIIIDRGLQVEPVHYKELKKHVIGEDGKIIPPPKPKSFIEKYWLYAIPILLILLVPPQGDDPAEAAKTK